MLDIYELDGDIWLCHSVYQKCYDFTAFVSTSEMDLPDCILLPRLECGCLQFQKVYESKISAPARFSN